MTNMNPDVFLSLLALDSYNRGYGQLVFLQDGDAISGVNELGRMLGGATVLAQSDVDPDINGVEAGFYAIAYDLNGETIISYRGTSFNKSFNNSFNKPTATDALKGWITGAGLIGSLASAIGDDLFGGLPVAALDELGIKGASQAKLAIEFYEAIQDDSVFEGVAFTNSPTGCKPIVNSGHSLGGDAGNDNRCTIKKRVA